LLFKINGGTMVKKIFFLCLIFFVIPVLAQPNVIVHNPSGEDTVVVTKVIVSSDEGSGEGIADETAEEIEMEIEKASGDKSPLDRERIRQIIRKRLGERIRARRGKLIGDLDLRDEWSPGANIRRCGMPIFFHAMMFLCALFIFAMWIISLIVMNRGFTRIAKAIEKKNQP